MDECNVTCLNIIKIETVWAFRNRAPINLLDSACALCTLFICVRFRIGFNPIAIVAIVIVCLII